MSEIWKPIKDFENIYEISNLGRIRNIQTNTFKKTYISEYGYVNVSLYRNKKHYNKRLSRLLAEAFIPNIDNKPTVDHIDRNRLNNDLSNLRWADRKEQNNNRNIDYSKIIYPNKHKGQNRNKKVLCVDTGEIFNSITEASKYYNVNFINISMCCRGITHTCNKMKWKFYEEKEVSE